MFAPVDSFLLPILSPAPRLLVDVGVPGHEVEGILGGRPRVYVRVSEWVSVCLLHGGRIVRLGSARLSYGGREEKGAKRRDELNELRCLEKSSI